MPRMRKPLALRAYRAEFGDDAGDRACLELDAPHSAVLNDAAPGAAHRPGERRNGHEGLGPCVARRMESADVAPGKPRYQGLHLAAREQSRVQLVLFGDLEPFLVLRQLALRIGKVGHATAREADIFADLPR